MRGSVSVIEFSLGNLLGHEEVFAELHFVEIKFANIPPLQCGELLDILGGKINKSLCSTMQPLNERLRGQGAIKEH